MSISFYYGQSGGEGFYDLYILSLDLIIQRFERFVYDLIDFSRLNTKHSRRSGDEKSRHKKLASIGQLAAGVAHEINNPLGTIILYASMLKKELEQKVEENQNAEDLELILEEANRCKNIVANLLNFARQGKLKVSRVNINKLLSKIIKTVKLNPAFRNISITFDKLAI